MDTTREGLEAAAEREAKPRTPLDSIPRGEVNSRAPILFDTGEALRRLREGRLVTRQGWNGKGMYVFLVPGEGRMLPYLCMSTVKGELVPWLISQTDALAMDWFEVVVDDTCQS